MGKRIRKLKIEITRDQSDLKNILFKKPFKTNEIEDKYWKDITMDDIWELKTFNILFFFELKGILFLKTWWSKA